MTWVRDALGDIRTHRLRYLILSVSMLLGMLSAVAVSVSGSTVADALIAQEELESGRAVSLSIAVTADGGLLGHSNAEQRSNLDVVSRELDRLDRDASGHVGFEFDGRFETRTTSQAALNQQGGSMNIRWLGGDYDDFYRFPITGGTELRSDGALPPQLVMNQRARESLGIVEPDELIVRPQLQPGSEGWCPAGGVRFSVVGTVADGKAEPQLYGSFASIAALCPGAVLDQNLHVRYLVDPSKSLRAEQAIMGVLDRHRVPHGDYSERVDTVQDVAGQTELVTAMFTVSGALLLIVSIFGIANVGLATVRERATELSIRQAFGASPGRIVLQVLGGSLVLGAGIAAAGVALTLACVYLVVPSFIPVASAIAAPAFPFLGCLTAVLAAMGASVIGGLLPAWVALRLPVAAVLRR